MIYSDADIEQAQRLRQLRIFPWNDELLQPASYDLTLAPYVKRCDYYFQENRNGVIFNELSWHQEKFEDPNLTCALNPNEFALFSTIETVTIGDSICGQVAGKSSWARRGLLVEAAGWVDPGFSGQLTLELKNMSPAPIILTAGVPIAQIVFMGLRTKVLRPYSAERNHYQDQRGPTEARA
jgi:dCTP deaminase